MLNLKSFLLGATAIVLFLQGAATPYPSLAQDGLGPRGGDGDILGSNPLTQLRQRLQERTALGMAVAMEGAVDAEAYLVGPGDGFMISIGGPQPLAVAIPVTADGRLILPDGEVIEADGRRLRDVRDDALAALRRTYRSVRVDVSLAQPRQFYVHVSGAVPMPGRYLALPVARVSDLLQLAFADTVNAPVSNPTYRPSLRNIDLTRRDGSTTSIDLARYLSTGETAANPYVRDGDVIHVSAYDVSRKGIFVNGAVPFPGAYDSRPQDNVGDLLRIAGLAEPYSGVGSVRLARQGADGSITSWTYTAADLAAGATRTPVQPLDHVSVQAARNLSGTAAVEGFVHFPGTYSIDPGRTTLRDLIELAGGLKEEALLRGAYLERNVLPTPEVPFRRQNRFDERMLDLPRFRADTVLIMQYLRQSNLDFMSRTQFAQGLRIQNRVSVDLVAALQDGAEPVRLQDRDRLVIPHDRRSVFVFGQVQRPGYVSYTNGRGVDEYIAMAGGKNALGADAYLIEGGTGRYLTDRTTSVHSGDIIFVDSRQDLADTPELQRLLLEQDRARSQERIQWIQAATQTVFALASLISIYVTLQNR